MQAEEEEAHICLDLLLDQSSMWKVKYGTGAEDPYLFSTNNFLGRQIFEFDPNAGTPEEKAQVEEARQNFYRNRYKVRPCSDHIWRLQVS